MLGQLNIHARLRKHQASAEPLCHILPAGQQVERAATKFVGYEIRPGGAAAVRDQHGGTPREA